MGEEFNPENQRQGLFVRFDAVLRILKKRLSENFRFSGEYDEEEELTKVALCEELDQLVGEILQDEDEQLMIKDLLGTVVNIVGFPEKFIRGRRKRRAGWKENDLECRPAYLRGRDITSLSREVGIFKKHKFIKQIGIFLEDGYIGEEDLKSIVENHHGSDGNLSEAAKVLLDDIIDFYSLFRGFNEDEGGEQDDKDNDDDNGDDYEFGDREESSIVKH